MSEKKQRKESTAALKAAKQKLAEVRDSDQDAGRNWETPEYLEANNAVIEAEKHVPWYRR